MVGFRPSIPHEVVLRQLRLHRPALLLLALLAVLATFVPDLCGRNMRQMLADISEFVPSDLRIDDSPNFLASSESPAEEIDDEPDEDDPPLLAASLLLACLGFRTATAAALSWIRPRRRSSSQFATGPPVL